MDKIIKILFAGLFLLGFIASVVCFRCSSSAAMECHKKTQPVAQEDSCLSHCLKQTTFSISVEKQVTEELKDQSQPFVMDLTSVNLQAAFLGFEFGLHYINSPGVMLNTGPTWFTPLLNHAPPICL